MMEAGESAAPVNILEDDNEEEIESGEFFFFLICTSQRYFFKIRKTWICLMDPFISCDILIFGRYLHHP